METRIKVAGSIDAPHGKQFLRKLCMHFAHKAPATFTGSQGRIDFPFGRCRNSGEQRQMQLLVEVGTETQPDQAEPTLQERVMKCASRDRPLVTWRRERLDQA